MHQKMKFLKKLFKGETIINGVDGYSRGKALLKSILYYKNGTYVKEIYELKNDFSKNIADKHPFIATLSDNSKIAVAFQLQNYYFNGLDLNSLTFGRELRNNTRLPVLIVVLLTKDTELGPCIEDIINVSTIKTIYEHVDVLCLDLYYIVKKIIFFQEPNIPEFFVSNDAKEWIKIIAINRWLLNIYKIRPPRFPIPKNLKDSKEIISAIVYLNELSEDEKPINYLLLKEKKIQEKEKEMASNIKI